MPGTFDDLNLNPLIVVEDDKENKVLPNEIDKIEKVIDEKDKPADKTNKGPKLAELEIDEDEDSKEKVIDSTKSAPAKVTPTETTDNESVKQWAKYYQEIGLLEGLDVDTFDGSAEDLNDLILEGQVTKINDGIEGYKQSVPQLVKDLLATWEDGADENTLRRLVEIKADSLSLDKIKDDDFKSNKELQKQVLVEYLQKTTQMSDKQITKHVNRLDELDELEEESTEALTKSKVLLKQEVDYIAKETKRQTEARSVEIADNQKKLKDAIKSTKEVITGIQITEGEKKDIENLIFSPVGRYQNGSPQFYVQKLYDEDPTGMMIKMNYLAVITKGFTDWSKIEKKATTAASKKVDYVFNSPPPKGVTQKVSTETDDWRSNLRKLKQK